MKINKGLVASALSCAPLSAAAEEAASQAHTAGQTGLSAIWILANFSYAGMRAQNASSGAWRFVAFLFGFPGTLLTHLVVVEGSERAYGVDIPRRK